MATYDEDQPNYQAPLDQVPLLVESEPSVFSFEVRISESCANRFHTAFTDDGHATLLALQYMLALDTTKRQQYFLYIRPLSDEEIIIIKEFEIKTTNSECVYIQLLHDIAGDQNTSHKHVWAGAKINLNLTARNDWFREWKVHVHMVGVRKYLPQKINLFPPSPTSIGLFEDRLTDGEYVLQSRDGRIQARVHGCVLKASSKYFETAMKAGFKETIDKTFEVDLNSEAAMNDFIHLLYFNQFNPENDDERDPYVVALMQACHLCDVKNSHNALAHWLSTHMTGYRNSFNIFMYARLYEWQEVVQICAARFNGAPDHVKQELIKECNAPFHLDQVVTLLESLSLNNVYNHLALPN